MQFMLIRRRKIGEILFRCVVHAFFLPFLWKNYENHPFTTRAKYQTNKWIKMIFNTSMNSEFIIKNISMKIVFCSPFLSPPSLSPSLSVRSPSRFLSIQWKKLHAGSYTHSRISMWKIETWLENSFWISSVDWWVEAIHWIFNGEMLVFFRWKLIRLLIITIDI